MASQWRRRPRQSNSYLAALRAVQFRVRFKTTHWHFSDQNWFSDSSWFSLHPECISIHAPKTDLKGGYQKKKKMASNMEVCLIVSQNVEQQQDCFRHVSLSTPWRHVPIFFFSFRNHMLSFTCRWCNVVAELVSVRDSGRPWFSRHVFAVCGQWLRRSFPPASCAAKLKKKKVWFTSRFGCLFQLPAHIERIKLSSNCRFWRWAMCETLQGGAVGP